MDWMELGADICVPLKMNHKHTGIPKHLAWNVDLCLSRIFQEPGFAAKICRYYFGFYTVAVKG